MQEADISAGSRRKKIVQDADGANRRKAFGQLYEELSELAFKYYFTIPSCESVRQATRISMLLCMHAYRHTDTYIRSLNDLTTECATDSDYILVMPNPNPNPNPLTQTTSW